MFCPMILRQFGKFCTETGLIKALRCASSSACPQSVTGLVIGCYDTNDGTQELTEAGERLNESTNGYIKELLKHHPVKFGKCRVFSGLGIQSYAHIALTSIGCKHVNKLNHFEQLNEEKENVRIGMAVGARGVQDEGANRILVDGATNPEAAAEGAILGTYKYKANITHGDKTQPAIELYDNADTNSWASGEINAEAQNWARYLSHAPPNLMKPSLMAAEIIDKLCKFDVRVDVRNREWMALRRMSATLALVKGSCQPPILLELSYCGDDPAQKPIVFAGKGTTFDAGGLFLKPYKGLAEFRADMAGAAAIAATIQAVARKRLPINVRGILILYENLPSPMGVKPGDVVKHHVTNRHIRLSNPDNDCRVVLSDTVSFTDYYAPALIIAVGTFTKSISGALGTAASGVFTRSSPLWNEFHRAGLESGDRVWRMPMWNDYTKINRAYKSVDIDNDTHPEGGDACLAASFLQEFVPLDQNCCCPEKLPYVHVDCYGTGLLSQLNEEVEPYYRKSIKMGRPTRALIQFMYHRACLLPKQKPKVSTKQALNPHCL